MARNKESFISYLLFANDLLFFAETSYEQIKIILKCLDNFRVVSGLKVSAAKISIFFSKNVDKNTREDIIKISEFEETTNIGRYLRVMLMNSEKGKERLKGTLDRGVTAKLKGRVTLAESVIGSAVNFDIDHSLLPKGICKKIEKLQRNFIWDEEEGRRSLHVVGWETICKPKNLGGLGLRNLSIAMISKTNDSSMWRDMTKLWDEFKKHLVVLLGDGQSTNIWKGSWIRGSPPLIQCTIAPIEDNIINIKVVEAIKEGQN
ncbi:hypothetical protein AHAS_Ahas01G0318300 [Arachis hypogaea]